MNLLRFSSHLLYNDHDPVAFARTRLNFHPDPVQAQVLDPNIRRGILNCCRQWGKSTTLAVKAVHHALSRPHSLTLVVSPSARQSALFLRKCRSFLRQLGLRTPTDGDNRISTALPNGARIVGIPSREDTVRGFSSVSLLLVDEAAFVPRALFESVLPMTATVPDAAIWLLSTPQGSDNFFFEIFTNHDLHPEWTRIQVTAPECPRISPQTLEQQRRILAPSQFERDYLCRFSSAGDAIYSLPDLQALLDDFPPIFPSRLDLPGRDLPHSFPYREITLPSGAQTRLQNILEQHYFFGLDLGRNRDYSVLSILERTYFTTERRNLVTFQFEALDFLRLVHLERFPLGTPYADVATTLERILSYPQFTRRASLAFDATGVGGAFLDLIQHYVKIPRRHLIPIVITSGLNSHHHHGAYHVPRPHLLDNLENLTKQRHLRVARALPLAQDFFRELAQLRLASTPSGKSTIQTARSSQHDDIVFSVALAAFASSTYRSPNAASPFRPIIDPSVYLLC
jgi:hypothetical protein